MTLVNGHTACKTFRSSSLSPDISFAIPGLAVLAEQEDLHPLTEQRAANFRLSFL